MTEGSTEDLRRISARVGSAGRQPLRGDDIPFDLDTIFAGLSAMPALCLAVSGGSDSMALLRLAVAWRGERATPCLAVATVDHGLRADSASEAQFVARSARELGLPHATLVWEGPKPSTRIQERAREARYRLLAEHARSLRATAVLTAHHADDQAETVLMRLGRGSGIAGLAAMRREVPLVAGVTLVRPFLDIPKSALVAWCRREAQPSIDDPSNRDPAYLRVRLRRESEALAGLGLDQAALSRLARRMARANDALEIETDRVAALILADVVPGRWTGRLDPVRDAAPEIVLRLLRRAILHVGTPAALPLEKLEALTDRLGAALRAGHAFRATLAGTLVSLSGDGTLDVVPQPSRRASSLMPN